MPAPLAVAGIMAGAGAAGALGARAANSGPIKKNIRQYIRKEVAGLDKPEDDSRYAAEQRGQQAVADATLGAQQQIINQQAMSATGGNPQMVGAQKAATGAVSAQGADAAVKQTSENERLRKAMREQRRARVENLAFQGVKMAQQDADFAANAAMAAMGAVPNLS